MHTWQNPSHLVIDAAQNTLGESQIILYIMTSQMYKSKLFCTSQIILYIPNYFVHPKLFCTYQIILYIPNYFVYHKLFCTFQINIYISKSITNCHLGLLLPEIIVTCIIIPVEIKLKFPFLEVCVMQF